MKYCRVALMLVILSTTATVNLIVIVVHYDETEQTVLKAKSASK